MTVAQLIDYLQQFPGKTRVHLTGEDVDHWEKADDADGYILLEVLDFTPEGRA